MCARGGGGGRDMKHYLNIINEHCDLSLHHNFLQYIYRSLAQMTVSYS